MKKLLIAPTLQTPVKVNFALPLARAATTRIVPKASLAFKTSAPIPLLWEENVMLEMQKIAPTLQTSVKVNFALPLARVATTRIVPKASLAFKTSAPISLLWEKNVMLEMLKIVLGMQSVLQDCVLDGKLEQTHPTLSPAEHQE